MGPGRPPARTGRSVVVGHRVADGPHQLAEGERLHQQAAALLVGEAEDLGVGGIAARQ
jgi:hypothetical protein